MTWLEALILGIIQGLTEFLPVSSSGHLEIGKVLLDIQEKENITFAVVVHGATVLSTIVVFYREIGEIISGIFKFQWNEPTQYFFKIIISMIPVAILGVFFQESIEKFFTGNLILVGSMLIITATLLIITQFIKNGHKPVTFLHAIIIGIAQAFAVMPGISRSGATIATGLILGVKRENAARFSFLMVLIPIILANANDLISGTYSQQTISAGALIIGFLAAFISGLIACKWMIKIVKKGKLIYFGIYCFVIGLMGILFG